MTGSESAWPKANPNAVVGMSRLVTNNGLTAQEEKGRDHGSSQ